MIEGKSPGLYGPAKGPQPRGARAPPFAVGNTVNLSGGPGIKARQRAERTEAIEDNLFRLSINAARDDTQVLAGKTLHAMYNGLPIARSINSNVDDLTELSIDELRTRAARLLGGGQPDSD